MYSGHPCQKGGMLPLYRDHPLDRYYSGDIPRYPGCLHSRVTALYRDKY